MEKGIEGIIVSQERYQELVNADSIAEKKVQEARKELGNYKDESFDFISFGGRNSEFYHGALVRKQSPNGELVAEIKRLRGDWKLMHEDLLAAQKENTDLKLDNPNAYDNFFKLNLWFWLLMGCAAIFVLLQN